MANYNSIHTGPQIDEAVRRALEGGDIDLALALVKATAEGHAARHSIGSADAINPADIGAVGTGMEIPDDDANNAVNDGVYRVRSTTKNVDQPSNGTILVAFSWDENTRAQLLFHNTRPLRFRTSAVGNASAWSAWDGLLPLSGGTLTGQAIRFYNGYGKAIAGNGTMQLNAYTAPTDEDNSTGIILSDKQTLDNALRLIVKEGGVAKYYKLFGEHNAQLEGACRILTGTYDGASAHGPKYPCTIECGFAPKAAIVFSLNEDNVADDHIAIFIHGQKGMMFGANYVRDIDYGWNISQMTSTTWGETSLSWYDGTTSSSYEDGDTQMNDDQLYGYMIWG